MTAASMKLDWSWDPGESVGPFRFGTSSEEYAAHFGLELLEPDSPAADWQTWAIPGYESRVLFDTFGLKGVLCKDSLIFRGTELLGIEFEAFRELVGKEDEREPDIAMQAAAYYFKLGATCWLVNGAVVGVTCTPPPFS